MPFHKKIIRKTIKAGTNVFAPALARRKGYLADRKRRGKKGPIIGLRGPDKKDTRKDLISVFGKEEYKKMAADSRSEKWREVREFFGMKPRAKDVARDVREAKKIEKASRRLFEAVFEKKIMKNRQFRTSPQPKSDAYKKSLARGPFKKMTPEEEAAFLKKYRKNGEN